LNVEEADVDIELFNASRNTRDIVTGQFIKLIKKGKVKISEI